jgi:hypothetical protein
VSSTGDRVSAAVRRAAVLRAQLEEVTRQTADVAEYSAQVHEQLAEVHEQLADPLLSPEQLRRHAEKDRGFAADERKVADDLRRHS